MGTAERRFLLTFAAVTATVGFALLVVARMILRHVWDTGFHESTDSLYLISGVPVALAGTILLAVAVLCLRDLEKVSET